MPTTRLAAIMFTDIVGYTSMMRENQALAEDTVRLHESVLKTQLKEHGGELLQTYGDGSLSIFESARAAVQCAQMIQELLREQVPLRIGLHIGEITREGSKIFGEGVNIASRIESLGLAGTVLFSHEVFNKIRNRPELTCQSLGSFHFKNVDKPMEVFALAVEGFPIPKRSEMQGKLRVSRPAYLSWLIPVLSVVLIAFLLSQLILSIEADSVISSLTEEPQERSIAVLPFMDLSPKGDQEHFSDGISEELLNLLTKVNKLKVASRTSSFVFKRNNRNIQDIAKLLDVEYVLEGSVRKAEDQVRITAQLIDAATDRHIWSETYDRELVNIFDLQDELAAAIVKEVNELVGNDSTHELPKLEINTSNLDAYELLLKAKNLPGSAGSLRLRKQIAMGEKAVELDPDYLDAWNSLTIWYAGLSTWISGKEVIDSLLEKSKMANQQMARISPNDLSILNNKSNLKMAGFEPDSALLLANNLVGKSDSTEGLISLARIYLAIGYFEEAVKVYEKLITEQDPNMPFVWAYAGLAYSAHGDYRKAEQHFIHARELGYPAWLEYELIEVYRHLNRPESIRLISANWHYKKDSLQALIPYRSEVFLADAAQKQKALEKFWVAARELGLEQHMRSSDNRYDQAYFETVMPDFNVESLSASNLCWVWSPHLKAYRQTDAFKSYIREANVLKLWKKLGFPPQCRDLGNGDFSCD